MVCVRVTDGTDLAASIPIVDGEVAPVTGMTLTARYSGTVGNTISVSVAEGSTSTVAVPTYKVTITRPNYIPEIFDNVGGSGATLWANIVDAINNGQNNLRPKSELVIALIGTSVNAPEVAIYTLAGGSNGLTTIDKTIMIGTDGDTRTGMYALRGMKCSVAFLVDLVDKDVWTNQVAFGLSEGIYMLLTGAAGEWEAIATAVTAKKDAGIDSYAAKVLLGDWIFYQDIVNDLTRLVSPQAYIGGLLVNLVPSRPSLNKELFGVVATQSSEAHYRYSDPDLEKLINGGLDVVMTPAPGGTYFAARSGHNSSSNITIWGDAYTRMTNYIAYTLDQGMGKAIGDPITEDVWEATSATLNAFLNTLADSTPPLIGDPTGNIPYSVQIDAANNPPSVTDAGKMIALVKVKYLAVLEVFLINLEGSQVTVIKTSTQPSA